MHPLLHLSPRTRALWRRLALVLLGSLIAGTTLMPATAGAVPPYPPDIPWGEPPDYPQQLPSCSAQEWATPRVEVHTAGFTGSQSRLEDAIRDVNAQIGAIGGSTARVESTTLTTEAFHISPYFNSTPVIHIGFANISDPEPAASTWNGWPCEHFITVDNVDWDWNFDAPADSGTNAYYKEGLWAPSNELYFRISYLHELLHAFGLSHPQDVYSFLNYGERPWAHAPDDAMIRPLPYDVQRLRSLFPGSASRTEVAVLNTWFDADDTADGVTPQKMLCQPSAVSSSQGTKLFDTHCGNANETAVCPGDFVQVHYALANYSTSNVTVTSNMWLSLDEAWDQGDTMSPTSKVYSVSAATAQNKYWGYEVPSLSIGTGATRTFYVIVRATATTSSGVTVKDSIPVRGTVTVGNECLVPIQTANPNTGPFTLPPNP